jgi:hypothetical protein
MCPPKPLITDIADALRRAARGLEMDIDERGFPFIVAEIHATVVDHFELNDHVVMSDEEEIADVGTVESLADFYANNLENAKAFVAGMNDGRGGLADDEPAAPAYDTLELPLRREALEMARSDSLESASKIVDAAVLYLAFLKTGFEQKAVDGSFVQEPDYLGHDLEAYDDGYKLGQMFVDRRVVEGDPAVYLDPDSQRAFEMGIRHGVRAGSTL